MPKWITKKFLIIALLILILILFITFILPLAVPILLALITAFLLEPLVKWSKQKFNWNRKPAVITIFYFIFVTYYSYFIFYYYTIDRSDYTINKDCT